MVENRCKKTAAGAGAALARRGGKKAAAVVRAAAAARSDSVKLVCAVLLLMPWLGSVSTQRLLKTVGRRQPAPLRGYEMRFLQVQWQSHTGVVIHPPAGMQPDS